ncbi:MAG TPA: hypothetical protein VFW10_11115 [Steroidobacteraceae bacterium]|nr:hypothetical protein [Steroidobacteraceae bacterium]
MRFGLALRVGYGALAVLLVLGAGVAYAQVPTVSTEVTRRTPYELTIHLIVDGRPMNLDRMGMCQYTVQRYHDAPTLIGSIGGWADGLPGAVALILPDQEGVVIELPNLCPGVVPRPGESNKEVQAASPLIAAATLVHYTPGAIWIRDVRRIDSFELYPSIQAASEAPLHVRVSNISVCPPEIDSHPVPATPGEAALAQRFGWTQLTNAHNVNYVAHVAYVYPESRWGESTLAREFFATQHQFFVLPPFNAPGIDPRYKSVGRDIWQRALSDDPVGNSIGAAVGSIFGMPPLRGSYNEYDQAYYEVPLVRAGSTWVLNPKLRGVRIYYDYSEIQRVPGKQYFQTVIKRPGWGPDAPLTYEGVKLYAAMNSRQKRLYLQRHPDVSKVTVGTLFDPRVRVLIRVGLAEISR